MKAPETLSIKFLLNEFFVEESSKSPIKANTKIQKDLPR